MAFEGVRTCGRFSKDTLRLNDEEQCNQSTMINRYTPFNMQRLLGKRRWKKTEILRVKVTGLSAHIQHVKPSQFLRLIQLGLGPANGGEPVTFPLSLSPAEFQEELRSVLPGLGRNSFDLCILRGGSHSPLQALECNSPLDVKLALHGTKSGLYVRLKEEQPITVNENQLNQGLAVKEELSDTPFNEKVEVEQMAVKKEMPDTLFNEMVEGVRVEQKSDSVPEKDNVSTVPSAELTGLHLFKLRLLEHKSSMTGDFNICTSRYKVVDDMLEAYLHDDIIHKNLHVTFRGETAEDCGGSQKEAFHLFWEEFCTIYCEGWLQKVPSMDHRHLSTDVWVRAGRILLHGVVTCEYWPRQLCLASVCFALFGIVSPSLVRSCFMDFLSDEVRESLLQLTTPIGFGKTSVSQRTALLSLLECREHFADSGSVRRSIEQLGRFHLVWKPMAALVQLAAGLRAAPSLWSSNIGEGVLQEYLKNIRISEDSTPASGLPVLPSLLRNIGEGVLQEYLKNV